MVDDVVWKFFGAENEGFEGIHNCDKRSLPKIDFEVFITGGKQRKKSETDVKTGAGETGRVEG